MSPARGRRARRPSAAPRRPLRGRSGRCPSCMGAGADRGWVSVTPMSYTSRGNGRGAMARGTHLIFETVDEHLDDLLLGRRRGVGRRVGEVLRGQDGRRRRYAVVGAVAPVHARRRARDAVAGRGPPGRAWHGGCLCAGSGDMAREGREGVREIQDAVCGRRKMGC